MIEEWFENKMKDPDEREKLFRYFYYGLQLTNIMIVLGVMVLIIVVLKPF